MQIFTFLFAYQLLICICLLNREEAHNQMFRDAFNKVQNSGSNRDFGTTKAAKMYFSMSDPGPNAFATNDTKPVSFN
jgi:Mn-containing catalase